MIVKRVPSQCVIIFGFFPGGGIDELDTEGLGCSPTIFYKKKKKIKIMINNDKSIKSVITVITDDNYVLL